MHLRPVPTRHVTVAIDPAPIAAALEGAQPPGASSFADALWTREARRLERRDHGGPAEDRQSPRLARDVVDVMAPHLPRLRACARVGQGRAASPTSSCSAWAARASRPRCLRRVIGVAPGFPRFQRARFGRSGRGARGDGAGRLRRCSSSRASRAPRSSPTSMAAEAERRLRDCRHRRIRGRASSRSPTKARRCTRARSRSGFRESSSIPPTSADAIRRSPSSVWCRRR